MPDFTTSPFFLVAVGLAVVAVAVVLLVIWVVTIDRRMRGVADGLEIERRKVAEMQMVIGRRNVAARSQGSAQARPQGHGAPGQNQAYQRGQAGGAASAQSQVRQQPCVQDRQQADVRSQSRPFHPAQVQVQASARVSAQASARCAQQGASRAEGPGQGRPRAAQSQFAPSSQQPSRGAAARRSGASPSRDSSQVAGSSSAFQSDERVRGVSRAVRDDESSLQSGVVPRRAAAARQAKPEVRAQSARASQSVGRAAASQPAARGDQQPAARVSRQPAQRSAAQRSAAASEYAAASAPVRSAPSAREASHPAEPARGASHSAQSSSRGRHAR